MSAIAGAAGGASGSGENNVMQLGVGDCFIEAQMGTSMSEEVSEIPLVDCAQEHDSEIFYSHEMADGEYPGDEAVSTEAQEVCRGENFVNFIGVTYAESEIFAYFLTPTQEGWEQMNDREILCYVTTSETGDMVTGTLAGANR
ncbi:septum formation family protein [Nocardiopsis halotolerans]|uniref:septum formation family protein n=1 Tax=Nocardiopsis halotolerans TaxID=124252 RepID=UPI00035C7F43|nr:septum formation family protein [Nocardiopsis halotolerans]